ncbi:porphobilinogen deaminase [Novimethylophilus kurashikiensis]|uniref:Porphobilinogen deaminase n=1 Tax=Novimethylophilus kurashikiensis TaxID=1825523 RepID=A0A2R5F997_9PROT|nr:DUF6781 family protein [Novimethylophilus kurashikiensis]GBG13204.1 porphobilinogen deaminase [Novimethylophilus kurashikiensis]
MSDVQKLTLDEIKAAAERLVKAGGNVRETLRELTVQALTQGELAEREIREVLAAITEGVKLGAEQRASEVKNALGDALHGMDDALTHAAEAMQLAIKEAASDAREFGNSDLQQSLNDLKMLEEMLLETLSRAAEGAQGLVKQELLSMAEHGRRIGTDTGTRVRAVADDLGNRVRGAVQGAATAGKQAARMVGARVAHMSSRKLGEIADRLAQKAEQLKH